MYTVRQPLTLKDKCYCDECGWEGTVEQCIQHELSEVSCMNEGYYVMLCPAPECHINPIANFKYIILDEDPCSCCMFEKTGSPLDACPQCRKGEYYAWIKKPY